MTCIHDLTPEWCVICTHTDDPSIPSPEPTHISNLTQGVVTNG